jgi:hypothetical protein
MVFNKSQVEHRNVNIISRANMSITVDFYESLYKNENAICHHWHAVRRTYIPIRQAGFGRDQVSRFLESRH